MSTLEAPPAERAAEIAANLRRVRERIAAAEHAAGRAPGEVVLVAVSKKKPESDIRAALAAGQREFGENYAQELRDKRTAMSGLPAAEQPRWHYIGPLQSNKVKYVADGRTVIHALDSQALCAELSARLPPNAVQDCLLQVNVAGESQKRGIAPDALPALLDSFALWPNLRCRGLMTLPPMADDAEASRPHFAALRELLERERGTGRAHVDLVHLSMGMSHDLEVAIAEGATFVRIGTAIFGARA